ncbi:MAG: ABC transporter ATP-binding protein [Bacteroidota bacterium]|nr:ABC transporter ATP-binding protein [Bacteroidota bacterium]
MSSKPIIQLKQLSKSYQEGNKRRLVLNELELSVAEGQMYVLLGRSGSGKSTMLNLLSGIDQPDTGQVIIDGTDISKMNEKDRTKYRRDNIGFVFQSFNLISTLTVFENVVLPLSLKRDNPAESKQKAQFFLDQVGLGDRGGSYPDRLSGGEQQRVAIARALAHEPKFILADEPTGNLDYKTGSLVLNMLSDLVRENSRTMIIATHDREMAQIADQVLELREGSLHAMNASLNVAKLSEQAQAINETESTKAFRA